jgi:hypothetical protein
MKTENKIPKPGDAIKIVVSVKIRAVNAYIKKKDVS